MHAVCTQNHIRSLFTYQRASAGVRARLDTPDIVPVKTREITQLLLRGQLQRVTARGRRHVRGQTRHDLIPTHQELLNHVCGALTDINAIAHTRTANYPRKWVSTRVKGRSHAPNQDRQAYTLGPQPAAGAGGHFSTVVQAPGSRMPPRPTTGRQVSSSAVAALAL